MDVVQMQFIVYMSSCLIDVPLIRPTKNCMEDGRKTKTNVSKNSTSSDDNESDSDSNSDVKILSSSSYHGLFLILTAQHGFDLVLEKKNLNGVLM
jgi:hypothetical protein